MSRNNRLRMWSWNMWVCTDMTRTTIIIIVVGVCVSVAVVKGGVNVRHELHKGGTVLGCIG
jgi:hypothetical protein